MIGQETVAAAEAAQLQIIAFEIGAACYGAPLSAVREIRAWSGATHLPNTAPYIRGVINLRGAIVPVIDLSARLGGALLTPGETHVVVIMQNDGGKLVGVLVDSVSDIVSIARDDLRPPPDLNGHGPDPLISHVAPLGARLLAIIAPPLLLDAGAALAA
ncbi:MAG TPA: chemotaxis protein CheW [Hyphomonadaceae bacterium]|nr:chemotaxis protein CheW [Hyphomonadaceae bacterium]